MSYDFIIRILAAAIIGGVIGIEREYRAKEAGFRTHFLVALGSALFMVVSQFGFEQTGGTRQELPHRLLRVLVSSAVA